MEQITGYTPGPWIAEKPKGSNGFININPSGKGSFIATCYGTDLDPVNEANARLIAAAPEMADRIRKLEAQNAAMLTELIDFCRGNCDTCELQECTDTCGLIGAKNIIETIEGRPIEEVLA